METLGQIAGWIIAVAIVLVILLVVAHELLDKYQRYHYDRLYSHRALSRKELANHLASQAHHFSESRATVEALREISKAVILSEDGWFRGYTVYDSWVKHEHVRQEILNNRLNTENEEQASKP